VLLPLLLPLLLLLPAAAVAALNDALHALGMNLAFQAPVSSGMWTVTDDLGNKYPFKVSFGIVPVRCCQVGAAVCACEVLGSLTVHRCACLVELAVGVC
jgi:hypothetical protein